MGFWSKLFGRPESSSQSTQNIDTSIGLEHDDSNTNGELSNDQPNSFTENKDQMEESDVSIPDADGEVLPDSLDEDDDSAFEEEHKSESLTKESENSIPKMESSQAQSVDSSDPVLEQTSIRNDHQQPLEIDSNSPVYGLESSEGATDQESSDDEHLEDLSVVDGQILPQLIVPDWRDELEFVKERYEPCDLTEHIVKVSKRRLTARRIDHELAQSRANAFRRYLDRASRRFKEKIDEDALLDEALKDLSEWRNQQAKSVAWKLAERINQELQKAKQAEAEATKFVESNNQFTNAEAVNHYRHFARRVFLIPLVTLYINSVVSLTYERFDWILRFLPFFNLGIRNTLIMISGIAAGFWLANLWRYSKRVVTTQKQLLAFDNKYQDQYNKIKHAVREHTRLAQQQPHVEPILRVLAKGYRVQLQSDVGIKAQATTHFDPATLPACVTLARAVDNDEMKMAKLKRQALRVLMSPGWRTKGLDEIARIHADSKMLDANSLSLKSLDTDSVVSANNAQRVLLEAFSNTSIHERVSKHRLVSAIKDLHFEVLATWDSADRPEVVSLRDDGFNKLSFRSSWLEDENASENWIKFLTEILEEETAPFGIFNIHDKRSELNDESKIKSVAVVPHYFNLEKSTIKVEKSPVKDVMPMDVVVRVDVSPWADPSAFSVFSEDTDNPSAEIYPDEPELGRGGGTSA